jgi:phosphatidate cytidylyltransferase
VLLPVVFLLLAKGGWASAGLMAFVAGETAWEFFAMALPPGTGPIRGLGILAAGVVPLLFFQIAGPLSFGVFSLGVSALVIASFAYFLIHGPIEEATHRAALILFGVAYCGAGVGALASLRNRPDGLEWVALAVILTFGNDTGAYFAGRLLGKRKLYPAVSPNKTWEGFWGGMALSTALAFVVRATFMPTLSALDAISLAIPCSVLGPIGDLCESMLKRAYGVKDSGRIIPGHGGLLDRIDALLFNGPFLLLYALVRFST